MENTDVPFYRPSVVHLRARSIHCSRARKKTPPLQAGCAPGGQQVQGAGWGGGEGARDGDVLGSGRVYWRLASRRGARSGCDLTRQRVRSLIKEGGGCWMGA